MAPWKPSAAVLLGLAALIATTSCSETGLSPIQVHHVVLSPLESTVPPGGTRQFSVEMTDDAGNVIRSKLITWTSDDESVAVVSSTGLATAIGGGTATITATVDGASGQAILEVTGDPLPEDPEDEEEEEEAGGDEEGEGDEGDGEE